MARYFNKALNTAKQINLAAAQVYISKNVPVQLQPVIEKNVRSRL